MDNKMIKCFHVSRIRNRESILKYGLIPKGSSIYNYPPRLFFSIDENTLGLDYVDFENVDVWTFYLPQKHIINDENCLNRCFNYTTLKIPPQKIILDRTII